VPEGDAVHRAARRLQALVGERIEAESPHPRGAVTRVAAEVDGRVLQAAEAVGKNLLLRFEGGVVVRSHLRMHGRWRLLPRGAPLFGRPWLVLRGAEQEAVLWNGPVLELTARAVRRVGPDVLAARPEFDRMVGNLRREPHRQIGDALLDQRHVAGIGNMWKVEALWHERLSPWRRVGDLSDDDLRCVLERASRLMRASLEGAREPRAIYRRRVCPHCGGRIHARGQGEDSRTTYWCPACQEAAGA
jgi:endonuclease-8